MRQRGRKSSADVVIDCALTRLDPPRYLNKAEAAVFTELAATCHFVPTDAGLLASLAQATIMASLGDRLGLDPKSRAALKLPNARQQKSKFEGLIGQTGLYRPLSN